MNSFSGKQLVGSLFCPCLTLLWGIVRFFGDTITGAMHIEHGSIRMTCIAAMLIGGILSVILTLAIKIHTEDYLKERLFVIAFVYVINGFIGLIGVRLIMFIFYMVFGVGAVIYQVVKVQDADTPGSARAILIISDPILYWTIYWFFFYFIEFLDY